MNRSRCGLALSPGKTEQCSLREFVQQIATAEPPMLAWGEPEPWCVEVTGNSGRRRDFKALVAGMPNWPETIAIAEARLFWPERSVHVVSDETGGCIWSELRECPADLGRQVSCLKRRVYTIRDHQRFGIEGAEIDGTLFAIEYSEQGRLVAWRLIIEGDVQ